MEAFPEIFLGEDWEKVDNLQTSQLLPCYH